MFLLSFLPWGPVEKHWPHSDWRQGAAGQQEAPPRGDFKERGVVMKRRKTGGLHATQTLHTRAAGGRMRSRNAGGGCEASPIPSSQCTVLNSQAWKGQGLPHGPGSRSSRLNHCTRSILPPWEGGGQGLWERMFVCLCPQHLYAKILAHNCRGDASLWEAINLLEINAFIKETSETPSPLSPWEDLARTWCFTGWTDSLVLDSWPPER